MINYYYNILICDDALRTLQHEFQIHELYRIEGVIDLNKLIEAYAPLVEFLADYLGGQAEVVLHDLTDLEHSIVKIRNGHISGRREGDPCTDFVLRVLKKTSQDAQYDANYLGRDHNGKPIKSGSFYIRNPEGRIIGMLCINMETESYYKVRSYLDNFFGVAPDNQNPTPKEPVRESFKTSISEMVDEVLSRAVSECGCEPKMLSYEGKEQLIEKLNDEGIFLLKGAVSKTAAALGISEPSVYRYLSHLKRE